MPVPPARPPVSLRPTIARPAPSWRPEPEPPPTRNPFKRYWQAVTDDDATWGRRVAVALGVPFALGTGALALAVLAVALYAWSLLPETPDAYALARATRAQPSVVVDVRGERITQFEPDFQEWVPLDSIPVHLVDALIATEDRAFYAHGGVDARRTVGAIWNTLKGDRQGGSTITQQLARNLFPDEIGNAGTVERKTKEAIAARAIEADHTKREILEAYLNTVPFLYNAFGVEMAARTYFGTHAPDLTVAQSALLVAMLKGPNQFNPVRHPEAATARRNLVLRLMADQGVLARDESAALQADSLGVTLQTQPSTYSAAPHFTAAVRAELQDWAQARGYDVDRDGLVVYTTLDMTMQREAEAAVAERGARLQRTADAEWRRGVPRAALDAALRRTVEYANATDAGQSEDEALATVRSDAEVVARAAESVRRVEASLVAIQPETGAVRAYVGSRDFAVDEYDHAGVARRQPGSTFKAFVFAGALQRGYGPDDEIESGSAAVELDDGTTWRPSGGSSGGTLADALAYSKNAVTARLTQEIGPHRVALVAQRMGVTSDLDVVPSIGLGTSPVTLLEMVSAYATVANDGLRRRPRLITRVETASGTVLDEFGGGGQQALTRRDARNLLDMMRGVVDRGTGRALRELGATGDLAGKTGTTQRYADGWFIAMRPGLAVGAWVGFNDQRVTFRSKATGEGSRSALPVVADFLVRVQGRLPDVAFPPPPGRYDALDFDADGDSLLVDEPDVADFDADDYENVFGEDPYEPAPIEGPDLERPDEDRPVLREAPPGQRRIGWDAPPEPRAPAEPPAAREPPAPRAAPTPRRPVGDPTVRNPNNRGGKTAEEILREARDGGGR
ncbi:transglycosylase domain-containing protein [Rubrivirga sp. IMCC45206]|uniref:transglycosylase domain-containing protein n=1 Tax=Rubrivirga sp. IMCC45206 TaxID=3391614 RepID=UPI0039900F6B